MSIFPLLVVPIYFRQVKFFDGTYDGVSYAGITPGKNEALPPPSCAASFPDLIYAPDPLQVRFGKVPWANIQSYIAYELTDATMEKYFMTRSVQSCFLCFIYDLGTLTL